MFGLPEAKGNLLLAPNAVVHIGINLGNANDVLVGGK